MFRSALESQTFFVVSERSTTGGVSGGEGLSAPPPSPHPRTFIGSHPLEPKRVNHFSLLSSAVLRWNRSKTGAGGTLSAVERDGASASALDRWIGRDVPAHLHPTRDRRRAAEAGVPGRRRKYFNAIAMQNKGSSPFPVINTVISEQLPLFPRSQWDSVASSAKPRSCR